MEQTNVREASQRTWSLSKPGRQYNIFGPLPIPAQEAKAGTLLFRLCSSLTSDRRAAAPLKLAILTFFSCARR